MKKKFIQHGVILGEFSPKTYLGGSIPHEVRVEDGDWTRWLPKGEKQTGKDDYFDCVSRALTSGVEIQENYLTGKEVNYSDRFLALRSETTRRGNYLDKVAEFARKDGLIPQELWNDTWGTWEEQYANPDPVQLSSLLFEGSKWLLKWEIKYEVIPHDKKSLQYHLKHAPLILVIPGHAIVGIYSNKDIERIFDSYVPWIKDIPGEIYPSKPIYAMKIVLYKKEASLDPDTLFVNLKYGDRGKEVIKLITALARHHWYPDKLSHDVYDNNIADLVRRFKKATIYGDSIWARFWEDLGPKALGFQGRTVDARLREFINKFPQW